MSSPAKKGLTASELKYIAILAMLIDHIAWTFFPIASVASQLMHFVGRTTAPIMCFFISEGYHHTRNLKRYFLRLGIFAVISHFAYAFWHSGSFFGKSQESMISTLFLCLLSIYVLNSKKIGVYLKLPIILGIAYFADKCDWGRDAVIFTLVFEISKLCGGSKKNTMCAYALSAVVYLLPTFSLLSHPDAFVTNIYKLGVFLPISLLYLYNGERGGGNGKFDKWVFYIFYPAHLIALGYINMKYS